MSRIGKLPIQVPAGVTVTVSDDNTVTVKGPKGQLSQNVNSRMTIKQDGNVLTVERPSDAKPDKAMHGLYRALIANMVKGVTEGFTKTLEIEGVGYRAEAKGNTLVLNMGYSHPVEMKAPKDVSFETPKPTQIIVKGIDKQVVGQVSAEIREVRKPEPYHGKGIHYLGEHIRRKEGKAGKK